MVRAWERMSEAEKRVLKTLNKNRRLTAVEVAEKMGSSTSYGVQKIRKALCNLDKAGKIKCRFRAATGRGRPSREYWLSDAD